MVRVKVKSIFRADRGRNGYKIAEVGAEQVANAAAVDAHAVYSKLSLSLNTGDSKGAETWLQVGHAIWAQQCRGASTGAMHAS